MTVRATEALSVTTVPAQGGYQRETIAPATGGAHRDDGPHRGSQSRDDVGERFRSDDRPLTAEQRVMFGRALAEHRVMIGRARRIRTR